MWREQSSPDKSIRISAHLAEGRRAKRRNGGVSGSAAVRWAIGLTTTGRLIEYARSRAIWQPFCAAEGAGSFPSDLWGYLLPDDLDHPASEGDAALDRRAVCFGQVLHLKELQLSQEACERIVEGVL